MLDGMHDNASRTAITVAAEQIAKVLIERKLWRTNWSVEVEGCVFRVNVNGYAKKKSPHYRSPEYNDPSRIGGIANNRNMGLAVARNRTLIRNGSVGHEWLETKAE